MRIISPIADHDNDGVNSLPKEIDIIPDFLFSFSEISTKKGKAALSFSLNEKKNTDWSKGWSPLGNPNIDLSQLMEGQRRSPWISIGIVKDTFRIGGPLEALK